MYLYMGARALIDEKAQCAEARNCQQNTELEGCRFLSASTLHLPPNKKYLTTNRKTQKL